MLVEPPVATVPFSPEAEEAAALSEEAAAEEALEPQPVATAASIIAAHRPQATRLMFMFVPPDGRERFCAPAGDSMCVGPMVGRARCGGPWPRLPWRMFIVA